MFRDFEKEAIRLMIGRAIARETLERVLSVNDVAFEPTGYGYYITVADPGLAEGRSVFDSPLIKGTGNGVEVGFVVFIENKELTFECHGWGDPVPENFRQGKVVISVEGEG